MTALSVISSTSWPGVTRFSVSKRLTVGAGFVEAFAGYVDRYPQPQAALVPGVDLFEPGAEDLDGQRLDEPGSFGEADEFGRLDQSEGWVLPSDECFDTADLTSHQVGGWLVVENELPRCLDRFAKLAHHCQRW